MLTPPSRVTLEGKGPVTLRPSDHIATGGEGSIYRVGDMAVKIYLDPERQRAVGMPEKIKLLAGLQHPTIVAPKGLVLTPTGDPIGHYLPFITDGTALSLVFTNEFWTKNGFDAARASKLVASMREAVDYAHQRPAQLVDANELNWFALLATDTARVIDVDSWAIGKWPASVIMPSIRDWNSSTFDDASDWFAWAIVTFQIYTGLHPYKGTLAGFDRGDLVGRMKARASVFSSGVRLNRAVRDFASHIPAALLKWYEVAFQQAERSAPPSPYDSAVSTAPAARTARVVVSTGGTLVYEKLLAVDPIIRVFSCGIAQTNHNVLVELATRKAIAQGARASAIIRVENGWLVGDIGYATPETPTRFRYAPSSTGSEENLGLLLSARQLFTAGSRMFAVTEHGLVEIKFSLFGQKPVASVGQTWGIMVNSTRWFDGFGVMDAMGATFLILPFGAASVAQTRVRELDGLRVVAGKAGARFVSLIVLDAAGQYQKIELTFDREYGTYSLWTGPADSPELNLAILPKGVCATILKDGELTVFVPTTGLIRKVEDKQISTDMALTNWNDTVVFIANGEVWSLKLK